MMDRLLGLAFGAFLGAFAYLTIIGIATFVSSSTHQALMNGIATALLLGLCIWGWRNGAYALGRVVAWLRRPS